jgi:hypothetical protein
MPSFARSHGLLAVGSAAAMPRVLPLLTAAALLSAACAPPSTSYAPPATAAAPPAHLLLAAAPPASTAAASTPPSSTPTSSPPSSTPTSTPTSDDPVAPPPASRADRDHGSSAYPRAIGWYSIGIGAGAALIAVGTSIMMLHQADLRRNDCTNNVCSADGITANNQISALSGWNVGSYIVAAAGLGIGTILVLTNPKNDQQTALAVSPNGSGAGLTLRSTF